MDVAEEEDTTSNELSELGEKTVDDAEEEVTTSNELSKLLLGTSGAAWFTRT